MQAKILSRKQKSRIEDSRYQVYTSRLSLISTIPETLIVQIDVLRRVLVRMDRLFVSGRRIKVLGFPLYALLLLHSLTYYLSVFFLFSPLILRIHSDSFRANNMFNSQFLQTMVQKSITLSYYYHCHPTGCLFAALIDRLALASYGNIGAG